MERPIKKPILQWDPENLVKRENAIHNWLKNHNAETFLQKAQTLLSELDRKKILSEFADGIERALIYCSQNERIKALDFSWYYDGSEVDVAPAYGLDSGKSNGALSNTDLGPKELPGIEVELKHGYLIKEDFSSLPTHYAINAFVSDLLEEIEDAEDKKKIPFESETVFTDLFQIWNYRIGVEACKTLKNHEKRLERRSPFWVTMTRHERWSIPIGVIVNGNWI
ncbi:LIC13197/LIC10919/LIC10469 family protein [Leptospira alstonii]|uniref:Uncharacterized protein n=2 Tax=Leptospira alstonii TaxID=28452 RepID=M6D6K3_9LEPT|nr:hypothetical protein [Leptospira alstonii]EMJ94190.1 hypothetical protein LEP1GSC194_0156 [Leptospira alstonii serovar Sichuan str. 79601]EQA79189.1 hypothetical protein LEP1GSC193_2704 [Leptospira alstonii serovar Pingchang str. 80-412]